METRRRRKMTVRWLVLFLILAALPLFGVPPAPRSPASKDRCSVCGMRVAPHKAWIAQVQFSSGEVAFFDGSKCLFRYLLSRDDLAPDVREKKISATFVTAYYDLEAIPLSKAFFVTGSDVKGPMGAELVPLGDRAEAEGFLADHGGQRIVRSSDVTAEVLAALR